MEAFDLDRGLIGNYESFSRSFTRIRAADLGKAIDKRYVDSHFWPDALLSINPYYRRGPTPDELVTSGIIDPLTARAATSRPTRVETQ